MNKKAIVSACPLDCFGSCSFRITTEGGQIVSLEPDSTSPVTGNLICSKGRSHIQRMQDPNRILTPLRRTSSGWEPMDWDSTLDHLAALIRNALETDGHHSIASYMGGGAAGKLKGAMELFFRHLGGGTVFTGGICWAAGIEAQTQDFGKVLSHSPEDLLNARTLVLWGKNPADTHLHLIPWIERARKNGCRVLLIDPIASTSARHTDYVIRPLPGTDWALALAILHTLLEDNKACSDRCNTVFRKQPALMDVIRQLDRKKLLEHSGVTADELRILAEAYGSGAPCATYMGYGLQRHELGGTTVRLIDLLVYLAGHLGVPGGGANYANKRNSALFDWSWAEPATRPDARTFQQGNLGPQILNASDPEIKLMFIACGNPVVQCPDSNAVSTALKSINTVVVIDHFMTDTAALADWFLPATYFLEEEDVSTSGMWNSALHYSPKISEPRGQCRSELWIFSELARRLQLDAFPQLPEARWIEKLLGPLVDKGVSLELLKRQGWVPSPDQQTIPWSEGRFETADGAFNPIQAETVRALVPRLLAPPEPDTFPLISFHRRDSINSQHRRNKGSGFPEARMHPQTAEPLSLMHGMGIELSNLNGKIRAVLCLDSDVRPGIIAIAQGDWMNQDETLNMLTPSGVSDIGEMALLNAAKVKIRAL